MEAISMHEAAQYGHLIVLERLLDSGVNVDTLGYTACSDRDSTALHLAAEGGHLEVVNLLLARGADAGVCNTWGHTAAHLAAQDGQLDVLEVCTRVELTLLAKLRNTRALHACNAIQSLMARPHVLADLVPGPGH